MFEVAITGASGQVGLTLVEDLLNNTNIKVKALYGKNKDSLDTLVKRLLRLKFSQSYLDTHLEMTSVNLSNVHDLEIAFAGTNAVIHLAAIISTDTRRKAYGKLYEVNVDGTQNVLTAMQIAGVNNLVLCSSTKAYVHSRNKALSTEELVPETKHNYDASKAEANRRVISFGAEHPDFNYVIIAPAGIIGRNIQPNNEMWDLFQRKGIVKHSPMPDGGYAFIDVRKVSNILANALYKLLSDEEREKVNRQAFIAAGWVGKVRDLVGALQEVTHKKHCWNFHGHPVTLPVKAVKGMATIAEPFCRFFRPTHEPILTTYSTRTLSSLLLGIDPAEQKKLYSAYGPDADKTDLQDTFIDLFNVLNLNAEIKKDELKRYSDSDENVVTDSRKKEPLKLSL